MWDSIYLDWLSFVIVMALGQFSPGPDMILLTRVALADGLRSGFATATGIATGLMIHAGIAIFFVDVLTSHSNQNILFSIYLLASMYLLWLAYGLLRSAFIGYYSAIKIDFDSPSEPRLPLSISAHYRRGLLCNLLNPKVAIFLAGVVLPYRQITTAPESWPLILWLTILLEGLILWCLWVKLLQTRKIKRLYSAYAYIIDGLFGIALTALAVIVIREFISVI